MVPIVRTADGEADFIVTDCLLKRLVCRGGGKEGQFIKVNYQIQSRHGIMIIGPMRS